VKFSISLEGFRTKRSSAQLGASSLSEPSSWLIDAFGGSTTGVDVNHKSALTYSAWWRGVTLIASAMGSLPFNIYEYKENGRYVVYDHAQAKIISKRVSEFMTSQKFREVMEIIRINRGNSYAKIVRDANTGYATELIILSPEKVTPYLFKGKKYFQVAGQSEPIANFDMIHLMGPSTDGIKGLNMIEYHRETLGLALENRNFQKKFYKNGGFMKGFLKVAGKLNEGKPKSISEEFDQNWGGPDNMYRTPVLQSGTEYIPVSLPQRDAQTLEQANASIEDVSRILDVPAHKLANSNKTSYASQEQENQSFVQDNLRVRAKEWEAEYDYKLLLNKPGFECKMNFEALLRADTKTRMEKYRVMFNAGAINPDQIREFEGMNPREDGGGKKYFTPMNLITNEQLEIKKQQEQKVLENE
jgi:HK97 family phage portal protein